jgi:hypothetical protein
MKRILAAVATLAVVIGLVAGATASAYTVPPAAPAQPPLPAPASVSGGPTGTTWASTGGPLGGNLSGITISPGYNVDHTLYGFNSFAGVYRSLDSGVTWSAINNGLASSTLDVRALAISNYFPVDNTLFIGTARGVFRSKDRGASWVQLLNGLTNMEVRSLVLSPIYRTDRTLYAGTDGGGIFVSKDAGDTWTATSATIPDGQIWTLGISSNFANDHTLYAGGAFGAPYVSHDAGKNWVSLASYPSGSVNDVITNVWVRSLGITPFFGNSLSQLGCITKEGSSVCVPGAWIVLIGTAFNGVVAVIEKCDDAAFTACKLILIKDVKNSNPIDPCDGFDCVQVNSIAFSPDYPIDGIIFASTPPTPGKAPVYWTRLLLTGGATPSIAPTGVSQPTPSRSNAPPAATSGTYTCVGVTNFSVKVLHVDATVTPTIATSIEISRDDGSLPTTSPINPPDSVSVGCGLFISIPGAPGANSISNDTYTFSASPLKFQPWTPIGNGLTKNTDVRALALSPNYRADGTVFAGTWGDMAYRLTVSPPGTTPSGTWVPSGPAAPAATRVASMVWSLAAVPRTGPTSVSRIYAATSGNGVYRRDPSGTWVDITGNLALTNREVRAVAAFENNLGNDTVVIGTFGTIGGISAGAVWRTDNARDPSPTWTNKSSGLLAPVGISAPDIRALTIPIYSSTTIPPAPIDPNTATIIAGTAGSGVYVSTDGGASWTQTIQGLDFDALNVHSVAASPAWNDPVLPDHRIIIGTDSGFWMLTPNPSTGAFDPNRSFLSFSASLVDAVDPRARPSSPLAVEPARPNSRRASAPAAAFGTQIVTAVAFSPDFNGRANPPTGFMFAGVWGGGVAFATYPGDGVVNPSAPCPAANNVCWQANLTGLGNLYPRAIVPSLNWAFGDRRLTVATLGGVYQASSPGASWSNLGLDIGLGSGTFSHVESLIMLGTLGDTNAPTEFFAGTAGRGVWEFDPVAPVPRGFLPLLGR